jgi:hypothetical protein
MSEKTYYGRATLLFQTRERTPILRKILDSLDTFVVVENLHIAEAPPENRDMLRTMRADNSLHPLARADIERWLEGPAKQLHPLAHACTGRQARAFLGKLLDTILGEGVLPSRFEEDESDLDSDTLGHLMNLLQELETATMVEQTIEEQLFLPGFSQTCLPAGDFGDHGLRHRHAR